MQCLSQFRYSCYTLHRLEAASWTDASHSCGLYGSHLWTINTHAEWNYVYEYLQIMSKQTYGGNNAAKFITSTFTFIGYFESCCKSSHECIICKVSI